MKKITFELHDAREELPGKSGMYVIFNGTISQCVNYSARHKMFNCFDDITDPDLVYALPATYWAEIPEGYDEVMHEIVHRRDLKKPQKKENEA